MSPLSSSITGYFHQAAEPFWKLGAKVEEKLDPFLGYFSSRRELYLENKELKERLNAMSAKLADRSFLRRENVVLKESLGRYEKEPERVFAIVLAKPDITPYDTLVLDAGYDRGVSKGDLVMFENVVLGEVTESYHTTSKARLYSSYGEHVAVFIGDDAIVAEAEGLGGGNFEIELPQNVDISIGDSIYIPEFQPQILGIVEQINTDPNAAFEKILFRSPVNLFSLRFVDIVHPSHE